MSFLIIPEKNSFKKEGIQRGGHHCDGEYSDFVMTNILEDEYKASE